MKYSNNDCSALMLQRMAKGYCISHHKTQRKNISTGNFPKGVCPGTKRNTSHPNKLPQRRAFKSLEEMARVILPAALSL